MRPRKPKLRMVRYRLVAEVIDGADRTLDFGPWEEVETVQDRARVAHAILVLVGGAEDGPTRTVDSAHHD